MGKKKKRDDAPRYRKLYPLFWRDKRIRALSVEERLVAAHALTSHQSNRCGIFPFSTAMAAEELDIKHATYRTHLAKVCDTLSWQYDNDARCLYIPTWWKWNPPENECHLKGCLRDLAEMPESFLMVEFARNLRHLPDTLHDTLTQTMRTRLPHLCDTLPDTLSTPTPLGVGDQENRKTGKQEQGVEDTNVSSCGETPLASSPPVALLTFPTDGSPSSWMLTDQAAEEWQELFPKLDILAECRKALAWVKAKPGNRKTAGGMKKFLVSWFSRATDRGPALHATVPPSDRMTEAEFLGTNQ